MTTTASLLTRDCWLHDMGAMHPECPDRLSAINDRLIASGSICMCPFRCAVGRAHVLRVHPAEHLDNLIRACRSTASTSINAMSRAR